MKQSGNNGQVSEIAVVKISFHHSRSKLFNRAISIAKLFPFCEIQEKTISCAIISISDYCRLHRSVHELIQIVANWKSTEITLLDERYRSAYDYEAFLGKMKGRAGKYAPVITKNDSDVSLGQISIEEELPFPIVYYPNIYGAFFAFSKDIGEQIYFCECERTAIENYIKLRKAKPLETYTGDKANPLGADVFPKTISLMSVGETDPLSKFEFKEGICFRCKKVVPHYRYCLPMYGGSFKQHYGWYIRQEYFKLGIDAYQIHKLNVLEDVCEPDILDSLTRLSELLKKPYSESSVAEIKKRQELQKQFEQTIENSVRKQLGFKKIGDAWVSETILFGIVSSIFEGQIIKRHYRPDWLEGLELDIFIPSERIAFEYQGIQHFIAVKHWGGEKQLEKQREHDARKKRICKNKGINLICINYNDPLTTEYVTLQIKNCEMLTKSFST